MLEKLGSVKNPLTIIAIFAGIAEVSGTAVLPFVSSNNQYIYIWFLMAFPFYLVTIFFLILVFKHIVLYAPSDYPDPNAFERLNKDKKFIKDYEENKFLTATESVAESITNVVDKNVQSVASDPVDTQTIDTKIIEAIKQQLFESISDKLENYVTLQDNKYKTGLYASDAYAFERRIMNILSDLGISNTSQLDHGCMDIIARKKDGTIIPIEIKYYQAPLQVHLVHRLTDRIKSCMNGLGANESILVISSGISEKAKKKMIDLFSDKKLHFVTGSTEDVLIPQLRSIFDLY